MDVWSGCESDESENESATRRDQPGTSSDTMRRKARKQIPLPVTPTHAQLVKMKKIRITEEEPNLPDVPKSVVAQLREEEELRGSVQSFEPKVAHSHVATIIKNFKEAQLRNEQEQRLRRSNVSSAVSEIVKNVKGKQLWNEAESTSTAVPKNIDEGEIQPIFSGGTRNLRQLKFKGYYAQAQVLSVEGIQPGEDTVFSGSSKDSDVQLEMPAKFTGHFDDAQSLLTRQIPHEEETIFSGSTTRSADSHDLITAEESQEAKYNVLEIAEDCRQSEGQGEQSEQGGSGEQTEQRGSGEQSEQRGSREQTEQRGSVEQSKQGGSGEQSEQGGSRDLRPLQASFAVGPGCTCRRECFKRINAEQRQRIFTAFQSLPGVYAQYLHLTKLVHIDNVRTLREKVRKGTRPGRSITCIYRINIDGVNFQVCKKAFRSIHRIKVHFLNIITAKWKFVNMGPQYC